MKKQKVALFHPWIKSRGGAERVILELLEKSKHDIEVYTWVYDKEKTFSEFGKYKVNVIAPGFGKKLARLHLLRGLFLPLTLLKKIPLEKYDKFLISTSGVAEFITFRNYKKGETYAYVHTPLREANDKIIKWNLKNKYSGRFLRRLIYLVAVKFYKIFEKLAWKKLDVIIFNSELSQSRATDSKLATGNKNYVIYPPVDFSKFVGIKKRDGNSFVYYSRLNYPKRQDVVIEAWKKFSKKNKGYKLVLIGTPDNKQYYKKLLELAGDDETINIKLNVSDKDLKTILGHSLAGLFLGYQEDFGIVPLEIINSGIPLLAVDEGGYVKIIEDNPNFYKIKELHERGKMVNEIAKELGDFVKKKHGATRVKDIKIKNFVKEIDKLLSC